MELKRFFTTAYVKNTYGYLDSQKKYEIIRTLVYFGVSLSLYAAGVAATKTNANLLTVVAVLGCLPASKSLVSMIMFLRQKSCSEQIYERVFVCSKELDCLYDLVFTTEKVTFFVSHAAYRARCLVLLGTKGSDTQALEAHIQEYMRKAGIKGVTVKVYTDLDKYCQRLVQLEELEKEQDRISDEVIQLLKEITL